MLNDIANLDADGVITSNKNDSTIDNPISSTLDIGAQYQE